MYQFCGDSETGFDFYRRIYIHYLRFVIWYCYSLYEIQLMPTPNRLYRLTNSYCSPLSFWQGLCHFRQLRFPVIWKKPSMNQPWSNPSFLNCCVFQDMYDHKDYSETLCPSAKISDVTGYDDPHTLALFHECSYLHSLCSMNVLFCIHFDPWMSISTFSGVGYPYKGLCSHNDRSL